VSANDQPYPVLSKRAIGWAGAALLVLGIGLATLLIVFFGDGQHAAQLDAIKTAGTIVVGTGGAAALWLAARRQQTSETTLNQKHVDQLFQQRDGDARRITELYGKAVELVGSDKPAVRLGGFYALERLAQEYRDQRQAIVNVMCAYLRMPFATDNANDRAQEREVRDAVQRIIAKHINLTKKSSEPSSPYWPDIDIDLNGASLRNFDLSHCAVGQASFNGATFEGPTRFDRMRFEQKAEFNRTRFTDQVSFDDVVFVGPAEFNQSTFSEDTLFRGARFVNRADFSMSYFEYTSTFNLAHFADIATFGWTQFSRCASFKDAQFRGLLTTIAASFPAGGDFAGAVFAGSTSFLGSVTISPLTFGQTAFKDEVCCFPDDLGLDDAEFTHPPLLGTKDALVESRPDVIFQMSDGTSVKVDSAGRPRLHGNVEGGR
jgi:uncharacterized protein YjbI with pentapeptide repeats